MCTLSQIIIYPIKSLGKISLKEARAEIRGLRYDRRMMLTDDEGNFLSQRSIPEMAKFSISFVNNGFRVEHNNEELFVPLKININKTREVIIWQDKLKALDAGIKYSKWFSDRLNIKCHLVLMDKNTHRSIDKTYIVNNETVSFADGFPYLLIGSASLLDLNQKLKTPLEMDRFRPNLVISTREPFVEDEFDIFKIGEAIFKRVKPCARCIITTTDQATGEREKEPLLTLSKYRKVDNEVFFGQNLICLKEGKIKIGDKLIPDLHFA